MSEVDISKLLAQTKNIDINDIPDINDDDVQLTAEDMNDPELLAQLAEFGDLDDDNDGDDDVVNEIDANSDDGDEKIFEEIKSSLLQSLKQKIGIINEKGNKFQLNGDNTNYKICQQSLKQLQRLYSEINELDCIEVATDKDDFDKKIKQIFDKIQSLSTATNHSKYANKKIEKASVVINDDDNDDNDNDEEANEQLLLQRYKMYKFAAKKANDNGDKMKAVEYLRKSKVIKEYVGQIREGIVIWLNDVPPALEDHVWNLNTVNIKVETKPTQQKSQQKPQQKPIQESKQQQGNDVSADYATPQIVEARIENYRIACVQAKKTGNIEVAKEYLREFKEMQKMLPFIKNGKIKPKISDLPKQLNVNQTRVVTKQEPLQRPQQQQQQQPKIEQRRLSSTEQNEYTKIIKQLKLQINECKSDASFLLTNSKNNEDQQLIQQQQQLLQYAKQSQMMLQKVIQCQKQELETPIYELFTINVKMQNINKDIEENELRLIITKLSNLSTKGSIECYCTLKIENLLDSHTSTQKAKFGCDFNLKKRIKIQRDKKLKHKIKYGKLFIYLYQKKFLGDALLGQAMLKLKPLLEASTIKETITIKPENERKKIADLDIEVKLRKPVLTEGYTTVTKKLIKITKFPVIKQPEKVSKQKPKHKPKQPPPIKQQQQTQQKQKPIPSTKKANKSVANKNVNLPNGLTQEMVDNPLGIEYIESFECISKEIETCKQEILKSNGKNSQDLKDRLQGLMTNKNVLEIQVNNGILTLEQYTAKVKKAMIVDLALAKYLKTQNRKMEAVKVLQRYKLMKKEIEGT